MRPPYALLAATTLLLATAGCDVLKNEPDLPSPEPAALALAAGLADGDLSSLEWDSTEADPTQQLGTTVEHMDGVARTVTAEVGTPVEEQDKATAPVTLRWSWDLGNREWTYDTTTDLVLRNQTWQASWSRELVEPSLSESEVLDRQTIAAQRGPITGQRDVPLVTLRPVVRVGVDRSMVPFESAADSARKLAELVGIKPRPYVKAVRTAGDKAFVEAIVYRADDVPTQVRGVGDIRGARTIRADAVLGPTADFARPILGRVGPVTAEMIAEEPGRWSVGDVAGISGLSARYDEQLAGSDGVTVDAVTTDSDRREVFRVDAQDGAALKTSLDENMQFAAESALADLEPAAALVAIRPSDGAVLAAASGPGANGVNIATYGQAAPGSTFKIVSSLALLRAGITPDDSLECSPTTVVDGKTFGNYSDYPSAFLGRIPLRTALAQSCNTAFLNARGSLGKSDLEAAAASLGFGIDHDLGAPAYFGQIPTPESKTEAAADLIGQGAVLASPMAMATVLASVVAGKTVVPQIVTTVPVEVPEETTPLTSKEAGTLREMLRGVVTDGSGSGFLDVPGKPVIAKTGTAEFDREGKRLTHAWMVAAQGDLAVAVFVDEGASGSRTAGPVLEEFLRSR